MRKIDQAIEVLQALGLPRAQQNERSALTLLALIDLKESDPWSSATTRTIRIHDILAFIDKHYQKKYAENTRETIRRQTIHQFEQAAIVARNPDDPQRPTNSPLTVYAISDDALKAIRKYGGPKWQTAQNEFLGEKGKLVDRYEKRRKEHLISVDLPDGPSLQFSPGKHNELQADVIAKFKPRFCPQARIVYVGDAQKKLLYMEKDWLKKLKVPITKHDKLPDVVLFDADKSFLILIEAVTSHGPLSPKRRIELEETLKNCRAKRIYVSAFPDFREFKRHIDNIAWDTEVWIANNPGHMIHFNGPKFFTVYDNES